MSLMDCLDAMQGLGVALARRGEGLVIRSSTFRLDDAVKQELSAHKGLLVDLLPVEDKPYAVGLVLDAAEAYFEREAVILESGALLDDAQAVALVQARAIMGA